MLRTKAVFPIVFLFLFSFTLSARAGGPTFQVDEIVEAIKVEIMGAQATEAGHPKVLIDGFDLSLAVVATRGSQGGLRFEVPGVGAETKTGFLKKATHRIHINMSLSEETPATRIASSLGILGAIQSIKSTLRSACNAPPHFKANKLDLTMEFAIIKTNKQNYQFHIIEAEELEYKRFATHTIVIHMSLCE